MTDSKVINFNDMAIERNIPIRYSHTQDVRVLFAMMLHEQKQPFSVKPRDNVK